MTCYNDILLYFMSEPSKVFFKKSIFAFELKYLTFQILYFRKVYIFNYALKLEIAMR
jgi:hypothetical protein